MVALFVRYTYAAWARRMSNWRRLLAINGNFE